VNVRITLTHTWDSDLVITLSRQSPTGPTVTLANRRGGSGDNFNNTGFDDEASTSIANGVAPLPQCGTQTAVTGKAIVLTSLSASINDPATASPISYRVEVTTSPLIGHASALHLDVAYVAVAKALGLPCQSYMGLSDAKILDAQAGAETFASALLAALAGVNSVSGPGMLDFVLVFSLPKLVFDDEMAGQALHFLREIRILDDLPASALVDQLMIDQHLIMADHTMANWPSELYLTGPTIDRENRENWLRAGGKDTYARACEEVDRRLAAYQPLATDPLVDAELQDIIRAGLLDQTELPELPVAVAPATSLDGGPARRRNIRRERAEAS
jgi:trimethylamine--corrinoid protein Co-methyltransferase